MGENGIHDLNMKGNDAVNDGSSTPNVPVDVHGRESERNGFGVAKGGQGLGDSFFFLPLDMRRLCVEERCVGEYREEVGTKDDKLLPR